MSPGEGNGNPLQYSFLENPMDRGAWWAAVHRVVQSQTWLKQLSKHACTGEGNGNPLQYSCLENPRDGGAWWAAIYGVAQSRTQLKRFSSSSSQMSPKGITGQYEPTGSQFSHQLGTSPLMVTLETVSPNKEKGHRALGLLLSKLTSTACVLLLFCKLGLQPC